MVNVADDFVKGYWGDKEFIEIKRKNLFREINFLLGGGGGGAILMRFLRQFWNEVQLTKVSLKISFDEKF